MLPLYRYQFQHSYLCTSYYVPAIYAVAGGTLGGTSSPSSNPAKRRYATLFCTTSSRCTTALEHNLLLIFLP